VRFLPYAYAPYHNDLTKEQLKTAYEGFIYDAATAKHFGSVQTSGTRCRQAAEQERDTLKTELAPGTERKQMQAKLDGQEAELDAQKAELDAQKAQSEMRKRNQDIRKDSDS
jgi:uncharacterized protein YwgA